MLPLQADKTPMNVFYFLDQLGEQTKRRFATQRRSEILCRPVETTDYIIAVTTGATQQVCNYYCIIRLQLFHGNAPL